MTHTATRIATWNVNSIRSRLEHLVAYLSKDDAPDILMLQELKCQTEKFPYDEIERLGYNCAVHGQKTYNGVAILSKYPIDEFQTQLPHEGIDHEQARYIEAVISTGHDALRIVNVYVPNGKSPDSDRFEYKMVFFDALYHHLKSLLTFNEKLIFAGDLNVAPEPMDIYNPKELDGSLCYHPKERAKFRALLGLGLTDTFRMTHPASHQFSWWDYRKGAWQQNKGYRIDHILVSPQAADALKGSDVDTSLRGLEKPSDHTPVWCDVA